MARKVKACHLCQKTPEVLISATLRFNTPQNVEAKLHWCCIDCLLDRFKKAKIWGTNK